MNKTREARILTLEVCDKIKILHSDDEQDWHLILTELIENAGLADRVCIEWEPDGEKTIERVQNEEWDLVITDMIKSGYLQGPGVIHQIGLFRGSSLPVWIWTSIKRKSDDNWAFEVQRPYQWFHRSWEVSSKCLQDALVEFVIKSA